MNAKEALLMLKLGSVIRRPKWTSVILVTLDHKGHIIIKYPDGDILKDTVESFLAQKWTDWEVYCPQDNK